MPTAIHRIAIGEPQCDGPPAAAPSCLATQISQRALEQNCGSNFRGGRDARTRALTVKSNGGLDAADAVLRNAFVAAKIALLQPPNDQNHLDGVHRVVRFRHCVPLVRDYHFACVRDLAKRCYVFVVVVVVVDVVIVKQMGVWRIGSNVSTV